MANITKNLQFYKFSAYGFLKNLRFFDAFFILYLNQKGLNYTEIGSLYAIREIIINISEVPSGMIADTYGRKTTLASALLVYIISFVFFYYSTDYFWFFMAFALYGFADAFRSGTHKGMIMEYLKLHNWKDQKIEYYGRTRSWSQMGSAISSLIAGLIVFKIGSYDYIFLFSCIPYVLNFLVVLSYPSQLNFTSEKKKKAKKSILTTHKHFWEMMRKPAILKIINTTAVHSAYIKAIKDYIQPLMVNLAVATPVLLSLESDKKNGLFIGIIYFIIYLLTSRASALSSKFDQKYKSRLPYLTLLLGFGFGVVSGIFYLQEIWPIAIIAFVGVYIIENIRKPVLTGYAAEHSANEVLTSVLSAQSFLKTVMTAILAFAFGLLADQFSIGVSLLVISSLLAFGTFIIHIISKRHS